MSIDWTARAKAECAHFDKAQNACSWNTGNWTETSAPRRCAGCPMIASDDLDLVGRLRKALEPFAKIADGYSAENVAPFAPLTDDMRSNPHSFHVGDFRRAAEAYAIPVTGGGEVVEEGLFVAPSQDTSDSSALLQELVELSAKATPGEWAVGDLPDTSDVSGLVIVAPTKAITGASCCCCGSTVLEAEDAELIVASVNYVRSLESTVRYGSSPETSTPEAVSGDWVTVPREPTEAMIQAACDATFGPNPLIPWVAHSTGYHAALAAAPTTPVTREEIARVIHSAIRLEWHGAMQSVHYRSCEDAAEQILSLLGAHHEAG